MTGLLTLIGQAQLDQYHEVSQTAGHNRHKQQVARI